MFGVVVCPRCRRAKGVDLKQKTTACACGFEIHVTPSRIRERAATARELAPLVGHVNAEVAGGLDAYRKAAAPTRRRRPRDVHVRIVGIASQSRSQISRLRSAAVELTRELEVFSLEDWSRVLADLGIPRPEEALSNLVRENFVLQPREGFYRTASLSP